MLVIYIHFNVINILLGNSISYSFYTMILSICFLRTLNAFDLLIESNIKIYVLSSYKTTGITSHPVRNVPVDGTTPGITIIYLPWRAACRRFQWSTTRILKRVSKTRIQGQRSNYIHVARRGVARVLTLANRRIGVPF